MENNPQNNYNSAYPTGQAPEQGLVQTGNVPANNFPGSYNMVPGMGNPNQMNPNLGQVPLNQMTPNMDANRQVQQSIMKNLERQESGIVAANYKGQNMRQYNKTYFLTIPGDAGPFLTCLEDSDNWLHPASQEINLKIGLTFENISRNIREGSLFRKPGSICGGKNPALVCLPNFGIQTDYKITNKGASCGSAENTVLDTNSNAIFKYTMSCSCSSCYREMDPCYSNPIEFTVTDLRTGKTGLITKQRKEIKLTNNYKVDFPPGITAQEKLILYFVAILIDFNHIQSPKYIRREELC